MQNEEIFDPNAAGDQDPQETPPAKPKKRVGKSTSVPGTDTEVDNLIGEATESVGMEVDNLTGEAADSVGPVIEDDVPLPSSNAGRKSSFLMADFPFDKMSVGQSFSVALDFFGKTPNGITPKTAQSQAKKAFPGYIIVSRINDDKTAIRFWRKK